MSVTEPLIPMAGPVSFILLHPAREQQANPMMNPQKIILIPFFIPFFISPSTPVSLHSSYSQCMPLFKQEMTDGKKCDRVVMEMQVYR